jgi:serine/threonine protein kinase
VAQALEYLHSQSIVHDDLHPKNILIDEHEHVRLSDYGLSGVVDASVPNSVTGGLAEYSGPEKIMGHSSQLMESDIFAFGCVCVQVGELPVFSICSLFSFFLTCIATGIFRSLPILSLETLPTNCLRDRRGRAAKTPLSR